MNNPFVPTVLRFDSLPSTNTEAARQAAAGAPEGLVVVAREQTAGRGRQQRVWSSPRDAGLYLSVLLRPRLPAVEWPLLTLAAALAVSDALEETCALRTDIKWPNDLLAGGRKLCGILAETVESERGRACVVGIGVNLKASAYPPELRASATSIEEATGALAGDNSLLAGVDSLIESLVRAVGRRYARLQSEGGARETRREWSARSSYAEGRRVRVRLDGESFEGVTRGLEPDGALRVESEGGAVRTVRAGDVTALRAAL
ncbi:MAG TPA: biotin--[acetyl-CoA-carboxylase] ligase [Pyrinomonadaceae bacterium]